MRAIGVKRRTSVPSPQPSPASGRGGTAAFVIPNADLDINRLRWRCRRGTRELDRLLGWWLTARYEKSDGAARVAFANMLDQSDPDLWDWLTGHARPAEPAFARIVDEIRSEHRV